MTGQRSGRVSSSAWEAGPASGAWAFHHQGGALPLWAESGSLDPTRAHIKSPPWPPNSWSHRSLGWYPSRNAIQRWDNGIALEWWAEAFQSPSRNSHCKHTIWSPPTQELHMVSVFASKDLAIWCPDTQNWKSSDYVILYDPSKAPSQGRLATLQVKPSVYQRDHTTEKL